LIRIARRLYATEPLGLELDNTVYALDSTTIDLCLTLFPWAPFRSTKAAIKLHTLLDLPGAIPSFIHISDGKWHDVKVLDLLIPEAGAFYVMDWAMTKASVGVAMGSGTDVARESADIVLVGNDLVRFADTVAIARRTRSIIWQNFAGTIAVDTLGIVLASLDFLNPLLAAFISCSIVNDVHLELGALATAPRDAFGGCGAYRTCDGAAGLRDGSAIFRHANRTSAHISRPIVQTKVTPPRRSALRCLLPHELVYRMGFNALMRAFWRAGEYENLSQNCRAGCIGLQAARSRENWSGSIPSAR
jgi:hypothetical protein